MPKIRGVKPDYWTDEDIVDLSIPARLLFIGLWTFACDNGHLQDKPKQIKMRVFPGDDVSATDLLRELTKSGRITRGDGWISIPNLTEHQKPDRRYFTTCDKAGCEDPPEKVSQRESRRVHAVHTPSAPGAPNVRTPSALGDGDGEGEVKVITASAAAEVDLSFDDFWTIYPRSEGKIPARKAWAKAVKILPAEEILALTRSYAVRVAGKDKKYLPHGASWLNDQRWTDELEDQTAEAKDEWFQPFTLPECPPEIADDPERYAGWVEDQRAAWRAEGGK